MTKEQTIVAGRYELSRQIGEGGMGKVYLAKHIELGQEVAIKCLRPESQSSANGAHRFYLEAKTYAAINHPNLVKLHDFERTEKGELRMVLEYVRGQTLGSFIKMYGALHPLFAIDIATQIAQGLSAAHHDNILHRDLKPENIMLSPLTREKRNYHVKILDFGIAKELDANKPNLTALGMVCGTPDYMSPEQACGLELDKSSDIYSLGVVFYEMLTGQPPYKGDKRQVMSAHCTEPIPLISDHSPYPIPADLEDVLQRCLAKNTHDRYKSLEELIAALDQVNLKNFEQKVPSYFLGEAKAKLDLKGNNKSNKQPSIVAKVIESDLSVINQSAGLQALSMREWIQNISNSLSQALSKKNGQQNVLYTGIFFVMVIMIAVSVSLKPHQPQAVTNTTSISDHINSTHPDMTPKQANVVPMPTNNNPTPSDLKDNDLPKASPITPKIQESQMKSTVTKVMATNETLIQVNNAYFSGKLTKALRLIKPYQEEQAAQPILTKIYALQKFKAKVKKTACNKRAQLFKEASPSIASHPFVLDGPNCKDTQEPPLFMKD